MNSHLMQRVLRPAESIASNALSQVAVPTRLARESQTLSRRLHSPKELAFNFLTDSEYRIEGRWDFAEKRPRRLTDR
jgi:hypothetical protein